MSLMKVNNKILSHLLSATSREQFINGKNQQQVSSCVLNLKDSVLQTICIVKDGKTSLSRFSCKVDEQNDDTIPVPDIDRLNGVLKYHGDTVTLTFNKEKDSVLVKSSNKQTTLVGGFNSKAYENSRDTLAQREEQAIERSKQIKGDSYIVKDGEQINPFFTAEIESSVLWDALRCDGINGQKLNRYRFDFDGSELSVSVGDHFKGMTTSILCDEYSGDKFTAEFEGGLENIIKHYSGKVKLSFLDFSEYNQGTRLILSFTNGDWVFQAGVL